MPAPAEARGAKGAAVAGPALGADTASAASAVPATSEESSAAADPDECGMAEACLVMSPEPAKPPVALASRTAHRHA